MKYFTLGELTKSETADRMGIKNTCTREEAANLTELVARVLDPLREAEQSGGRRAYIAAREGARRRT